MEKISDLNTFLEMVRKIDTSIKSIKTSSSDLIKLRGGIEIEFDNEGNLRGINNQYNPNEQIKRLSSLLQKISMYFTNLFPKLNEEQFENNPVRGPG